MEQAHRLFFMVVWAGFHDRADDDFQQPAADGVDRNGNQDAGKRSHHVRQEGKQHQPQRRQHVRQHHAGPVADPVHKGDGDQVHQQLHAEIKGDQQRHLGQGQAELILKRDKQQGNIYVDDGLGDIAEKAGMNGGGRIVGSHALTPFPAPSKGARRFRRCPG